MKRILFLCLTLLGMQTGFAQTAHNTNCMRCRYSQYQKERANGTLKRVKGEAMNECACMACGELAEKERVARLAEDKKRTEEAIAKTKAIAEARRKAFAEEQLRKQAEAKKAKSGEVLINEQPKTKTAAQPATKPAAPTSTRFMRANFNTFYDMSSKELVRTVALGERPALRTYGTELVEGKNIARYLHPAEVGVVQYVNNPTKYCNDNGISVWDIVNYNWEPLFKNDDVHYIEHFYGDWFLIGYMPCDGYMTERSYTYNNALKLYNVSTKKFQDINVEGTFVALGVKTDATRASRHNGVGNAVFHNPFYISGSYEEGNYKHGAYELLFDEATGGRDGWKAAVPVQVKTGASPNDYSYIVCVLGKDNSIKTYAYDKAQYDAYHYKPAE